MGMFDLYIKIYSFVTKKIPNKSVIDNQVMFMTFLWNSLPFGCTADGIIKFIMYVFFQAKFCKNMEKTRDLWNLVMQSGFGNQAAVWLEYFNLER